MEMKKERFTHITSRKPGTLGKRYYHLFDAQNNDLFTFSSKFDAMHYAHTTFKTPVVNPTSIKSFIAKKMVWLPNDGTPSRFEGDTFTYTGDSALASSANQWRLDIWHYIKTVKLITPPSTQALENARIALGIPEPYTPLPDYDLQIQIITNFFHLSHMTEATGKASGLRWLTTLELQQYIELYAKRYLKDLIPSNTTYRQIDRQLILVVAKALGFQSGFEANTSNKDYKLFSAVGGVAIPFPLSGAIFNYSTPSYIDPVPDRMNTRKPKNEPVDKRFQTSKVDIAGDIALLWEIRGRNQT